MNSSALDAIKNQLSSKITVYLDEDTYAALKKDIKDFDAKNPNSFVNRLVKNYVSDYFSAVYETVPEIMKILSESGLDLKDESIEEVAKQIAFVKGNASKKSGNLKKKLNIKLGSRTVNDAIEALYNGPVSLDISAFFRNMFLSYLSLPVYKRERIIYKGELEKIERAIKSKEKLSYLNKEKNETHVLNPYCVEPSSFELYNYVIGESDNSRNIVSIRLSNIKDIVPVHQSASFSDKFAPYFERMKRNGIQFGINETGMYCVTLNEKQYAGYWKKYLDRPEIIKEERDGDLHKCYFDCSEFQIKTFFTPFANEGRHPKIEKIK